MDRILQFIEEHFICKFKEHTNQTVMAYICRRRLIKACDDIVSSPKYSSMSFLLIVTFPVPGTRYTRATLDFLLPVP